MDTFLMGLNISILTQNLIPEQLLQTKFSEIPVYEISLQKSVPSIKWLIRRHNDRKTSI